MFLQLLLYLEEQREADKEYKKHDLEARPQRANLRASAIKQRIIFFSFFAEKKTETKKETG